MAKEGKKVDIVAEMQKIFNDKGWSLRDSGITSKLEVLQKTLDEGEAKPSNALSVVKDIHSLIEASVKTKTEEFQTQLLAEQRATLQHDYNSKSVKLEGDYEKFKRDTADKYKLLERDLSDALYLSNRKVEELNKELKLTKQDYLRDTLSVIRGMYDNVDYIPIQHGFAAKEFKLNKDSLLRAFETLLRSNKLI